MTTNEPRVLLIAEAANPEWVSVPLIGWSHSQALREVVDAHVVTQIRNKAAIERAGWVDGHQFTAIDSESVAYPIHRINEWLRRVTGLGWTLTTALESLPYYKFEHEVWRRFGPEIRAGRYDIVHRLTPLSPTIPSWTLARECSKARVPFVWGPINGGVPWPKEFAGVQRAEGEWLSHVRDAHKLLPGFRATRENAGALIAGSQSAWQQLSEFHDRTVYIPENAVDPSRFSFEPRSLHQGPLRVAFVGRLVPYKGADMLIEAAAPFIREGRVIVDVIGDGPEMPRLKGLRDQLGLGDGVLLDGWIPHTQLQGRLGQAQIFGFPSVREFGGGVVLEAMAMGLVPVVVGYAGPNELVDDDTGIRVQLGPRSSIVQGVNRALDRLLNDRAVLASMGEKGSARIRELFTWRAKALQVREVYMWLLGRRAKPDFGLPLRADSCPKARVE
jgi:alpha-maltose-1-phosphate synthase